MRQGARAREGERGVDWIQTDGYRRSTRTGVISTLRIRSLFIRQANIDKRLTCSVLLYNYRVKRRERGKETRQSTSKVETTTSDDHRLHHHTWVFSFFYIHNNVLVRSMYEAACACWLLLQHHYDWLAYFISIWYNSTLFLLLFASPTSVAIQSVLNIVFNICQCRKRKKDGGTKVYVAPRQTEKKRETEEKFLWAERIVISSLLAGSKTTTAADVQWTK